MKVGGAKHLYIAMEIKAREFLGRGFLAFSAAERGWTVFIGRQDMLRSYFLAGGLTGIYLEKSITPIKLPRLSRLVSAGAILVSQDEESGLLDRSYRSFAESRMNDATLEVTSRMFCWGDFDTKGCKDAYPDFAHKFTPTGSPRVDFWREDMRGFFSEETRRLQQKFGRFILIPSNFGLVHHAEGVESVFRQLRKRRRISSPRDLVEFEKKVEAETRLRDRFVRLIEQLGTSVDDTTIIVRPHPVEKISAWANRLKGMKNVVIVRSGAIDSWVLGAEAIIHNGCTTALQAVSMGKPVIAFRPVWSKWDRAIPNQISVELEDPSELLALVRDLRQGQDARVPPALAQIRREIIGERFTNLSGKLAVDRILDQLECELSKSDPMSSGFRLKDKVSWWKKAIIRNGYPGNTARRKFPELTSAELNHFHDRLTRSTGRFKSIEMERVGRDLFMLRSS